MNELKHVEDIFQNNQLTNLVKNSLKEIVEVQNSIKMNE